MKSCQATFCTSLKICQKWARFIRNVKLCKFIENTLKIDYNGRNFNIVEKGKNFAYGECCKNFNDTVRFLVEHYPNVGCTKFKIQTVVNLGRTQEANVNYITLLQYPDRVLVLYGRIKASSIINYVFNFVNICKFRKINVKYVNAFVRRGVTKIRRYCAFVSYASTFLHLQPRLTQFFSIFLQTRRLSRTSFSLQHFLLTISFLI
jgi:hypothetical protein